MLGVFWGAPTGGGGAPFIASFALSGVVNGTFNNFGVGPVAVPADFLVGVYLPSGGADGQLGLRSASTLGQGFHGMQISFGGGSGSNYQSISGQNAMLRTAGNIIIPVELMEFEVD